NQVGNKLELEFLDQGEKTVKNIAQPVHVYFVNLVNARGSDTTAPFKTAAARARPDKPSVAILPFSNMSNETPRAIFTPLQAAAISLPESLRYPFYFAGLFADCASECATLGHPYRIMYSGT